MTEHPLNPDDEARLKMALEQSANGQVVSRGSFAQPPLNELGIERAQDAYGDAILNRWWPRKTVIRIIRAYLAAQPVVNIVEELDKLPNGTLVRSGGREFYKTSRIEYPWVLPYGVGRFGSSYLAKHSKVTVVHRPDVNDA